MKYISIVGFEEHQHYKDRNVIWIKLYVKLLNSEKVFNLTFGERWFYISLLLLAATKNNKIPQSIPYLAETCHLRGLKCPESSLKKMARLKLITLKSDSRSLSRRYQVAIPEEKEEKERKKEVVVAKNNLLNKFKMPL